MSARPYVCAQAGGAVGAAGYRDAVPTTKQVIAPRWRRLLPDAGTARTLAVATFVTTFGTGLFLVTSVLYFTRIVGLSASQVGIGLTISGAFGLAAGVPAGHLGDRIGPRGLLVVLTVGVGVVEIGYLRISGFLAFVAVSSAVTLLDRASGAVRSALIAGALPSAGRVRARAYLRAVTNLGISFGTLVGGIALHLDTPTAYRTMVVLDAVTFVAAGLVLLGVPAVRPTERRPGESRLPVLRDRSYLALAGLNAVLSLHYSLLDVAVPLWVVGHTKAPRALVAGVFLVNTVMCVLFQVRASRGTEDLAVAGRVQCRAGLLLLLACALFGLASGLPTWAAVVLLLAAAFTHVIGELLQAAGSWGIGYGLAPAHLQGQYQGVYNTGMSVAGMLAPVVLVELCVNGGLVGWLVLGLLFAGAGAAVPAGTRWAVRSRPAAVAASAMQ